MADKPEDSHTLAEVEVGDHDFSGDNEGEGGDMGRSGVVSPSSHESTLSDIPVVQSAVLAELKETDEAACFTLIAISAMKESIENLQAKDSFTDADAKLLEQKQILMMEKLMEFQEQTKKVQNLVGLETVSVTELQESLLDFMVGAIPATDSSPSGLSAEHEFDKSNMVNTASLLMIQDKANQTGESSEPDLTQIEFIVDERSLLPKVVVCGLEDILPKIIVCEPPTVPIIQQQNMKSFVAEVTFHVATLMPTKESVPHCNDKKLHIGNNYVTIVYNESGEEYNIQTVKGQFNYACVIIQPLDHSTNEVAVKTREELAEHITHSESKIVSDENLAILARQLALHANLASMVSCSLKAHGQDPYASNWLERLRKIKRLKEKVEASIASVDGAPKELTSPKNSKSLRMDDFTEYT